MLCIMLYVCQWLCDDVYFFFIHTLNQCFYALLHFFSIHFCYSDNIYRSNVFFLSTAQAQFTIYQKTDCLCFTNCFIVVWYSSWTYTYLTYGREKTYKQVMTSYSNWKNCVTENEFLQIMSIKVISSHLHWQLTLWIILLIGHWFIFTLNFFILSIDFQKKKINL